MECARLYCDVFTKGQYQGEQWTEQSAYHRLFELQAQSPGLSVLATEESEIIGFTMVTSTLWWNGRNAEIVEFLVKPAYQHQGIGTRLLASTKTHLQSKGVVSIYSISRAEGSACSFYVRQGLRPTRYLLLAQDLDGDEGKRNPPK